MMDDESSPNDEIRDRASTTECCFVIRASSFLHHPSFVLRHLLLSQLREQGRLAFFLRQRARPLLAFFHDELIQRRINRQRIVPVKTSETKRIGGPAGRLN